MPDGNAVELRGLPKAFGDMLALYDVSFAVPAGEVFGFISHNGAGKTTTIRLLLGLLRPTRGEASILGHDIVRDSLAIRLRVILRPRGAGSRTGRGDAGRFLTVRSDRGTIPSSQCLMLGI
jgi:ABC-type multidrug transport system ATPase subunit